MLSRYRKSVELKNAQEARLEQVKAMLKTEKDKETVAKLKDEKTSFENRITIYDSQLLRMENAKPLQYIVERQKESVRKRTRKRYQEKAKEQMAWVAAMNNIRDRANEIVLDEVIFV